MSRHTKAIKLVRWGFNKDPVFVLSVARKRSARNSGARYEDVGLWDPTPGRDGLQHLGLKSERIKHWLAKGAQPTDKVSALLERVGLLPPRPEAPRVAPWPKPNADTKWRPELANKGK